jgi:hypothetical protein
VRRGRVEHLLEGHVRHGSEQIERRRPVLPKRPQYAPALVEIARVCDRQSERGSSSERGWERLLGRDCHERLKHDQFVGCLGHEVAREAQDVAGAVQGMQHDPGEDVRPERVKLELELRHHAEVAAAAAQGPEQVGILVVARTHEFAFGGDELDRADAVTREPVLAHDPANSATEREASDAGMRDVPEGRRGERVRGGGTREVAQERSAADLGAPRGRIDLDGVDRRQIDRHAALGHRVAGEAMAAAAHGDLEFEVTRMKQGGGDLLRGPRLDDQRRPTVRHRVEEPAGGTVALIRRRDHLAPETPLQALELQVRVGRGRGFHVGSSHWPAVHRAACPSGAPRSSGESPIPTLVFWFSAREQQQRDSDSALLRRVHANLSVPHARRPLRTSSGSAGGARKPVRVGTYEL